MKHYFHAALLLLLLSMGYSCKKESRGNKPSGQPKTGSSAILLKDIEEQGSPSAYFHFDYNDTNQVKALSFAAGYFSYETVYANGRLQQMRNLPDHSTLHYVYTGDLVHSIYKTDAAGKKLWVYELTYNDRSQVIQLNWFRYNGKRDSVHERRTDFQYFADGNLASFKDYWRDASGELTPSRTLRFANYDKGTNVDDFYVFKTFFEDVLYLPGIRFQVNNPGLVTIDGMENDYTIRYNYSYHNSLPVEREGTMLQTSGKGKGFRMALHTGYTYYTEKIQTL